MHEKKKIHNKSDKTPQVRSESAYLRQQYKNVHVNKGFIELRVQITGIHRNHAQ